MKEETEQNLNEVIDYLQSSAKTTENFLSEQTPKYIEELLRWEFTSNMIGVVVFAIPTLVFLFFGVKSLFKSKFDINKESFGFGLFMCMLGFAFSSFSITFSVKAYKVKTAPRVVIMKHLAKTFNK